MEPDFSWSSGKIYPEIIQVKSQGQKETDAVHNLDLVSPASMILICFPVLISSSAITWRQLRKVKCILPLPLHRSLPRLPWQQVYHQDNWRQLLPQRSFQHKCLTGKLRFQHLIHERSCRFQSYGSTHPEPGIRSISKFGCLFST